MSLITNICHKLDARLLDGRNNTVIKHLDSHIKKLRGKLATLTSQGQFIHSVYGAGYKATQTPD